MKNDTILTVTLNPAIDKTVYCDDFDIGQDHRASDIYYSAGGKGINVSRVLKQLGCKTLATGFIGGKSGKFIKDELDREEINYDFVEIMSETRTSLTILDKKNSRSTRLLEQGPKIKSEERIRFLELFAKLSEELSWVIISGRSPQGIGDDFYQKMLEICSHKSIATVLDSSGIHFSKGLYSRPTLIKPNIEEAEEILGYNIKTDSDIKKACLELKNKGSKYVCISRASQGAVFYDGIDFYFGSVPKLEEESPVGCGDAFIAGFCSALNKKQSIEESFRNALACGCANVLNKQPGRLEIKSFEQIKENIVIQKRT